MYAKSIVILIIIAIFAGATVSWAFAADNTIKAGNPSGCITDVCKQFEVWKGNFLGFLRWLFPVGIATAGVLSVIMIIFAGFQWMAGAISPPQIEAAKSRIAAALGGLFLALVSWIVLYTINPDLVTLRNPADLDKLKLQCPKGGCPKLEEALFGVEGYRDTYIKEVLFKDRDVDFGNPIPATKCGTRGNPKPGIANWQECFDAAEKAHFKYWAECRKKNGSPRQISRDQGVYDICVTNKQ